MAILSILLSALRNPTVLLVIAAVGMCGYVGVKSYRAGYASAVLEQQQATAELNKRLDNLATELAISRAADENLREAAYNEALASIQGSGAACVVSDELAAKLNAIH